MSSVSGRDDLSKEIRARFVAFDRQYIEKTLKEGKEWMAPPTPSLAVRSALHVRVLDGHSPFLFSLKSNPNIKIFYLNLFTWLRLPAPARTDELTKMYSLPPMETTHNNGK